MIRASICADPALAGPAAQHAVAHRLLQHLLVDGLGLPPAEVGIAHNSYGGPYLRAHPDVHVSVAHCAGVTVAAASAARLGVDVEPVRPHDPVAATRTLHPAELAQLAASADPDRDFFRYWTLKESYGKALGVGLGYAVRDVRVHLTADGAASIDRPRVHLRLVERFTGHVLAFCTIGGAAEGEPDLERVGLAEL